LVPGDHSILLFYYCERSELLQKRKREEKKRREEEREKRERGKREENCLLI
jgi:hypothetical protein